MARSAGVEEYSRAFGHETHDDRLMFEFLLVGVFQVGMSWQVAASKLPVYRRVFANLDIAKVAAMDLENIDAIMADPDMIHNQRKIRAVIKNARAVVGVQQEYGSFANYMWQFADGVPHTKTYENEDEVEMTAPFAGMVAKDMKQHGFTFVGPTVTYLFMKASGMIQDQVLNR